MIILLAVLLSAASQAPSTHICDVRQARDERVVDGKPAPLLTNPLVAVPHIFWFCGPPEGEQVPYTWSLDGVQQPSPGVLVMAHYEQITWPDNSTAGRNGLVPYISPGQLLRLRAPGPHTIRVVYGAGQRAVSFQVIGSTAVCEKDPRTGQPLPVGAFGLSSPILQDPSVCQPESGRRKPP